MLAVALSLGSSLAFGVADFLGGVAARRLALLSVLLVSQAAGLVGIALVVAARGAGPPDARFVPLALLAALFATVGLAALYHGLATGLMGVVAPITAVGAAIPVIVGFATGEAPSRLQSAGMALALGGVVLVSRTKRVSEVGSRLATGGGLGLAAALAFGFFFVAFDAASEDDPYWATLAFRTSSFSLLAAISLVRRPPLRLPARAGLALVVIGLLDLAGNALFAVATTKGLVGVVAVLTSLYPVVTVALASVILRERLGAGQAFGVVGALGGVALIAAG